MRRPGDQYAQKQNLQVYHLPAVETTLRHGVSQQSEKFLFQQSRKFLFRTGKLP